MKHLTNSCNPRNFQNEKIDANSYKYTKEKEPFFFFLVIPMMQLELILLVSLFFHDELLASILHFFLSS
jgi:hypothetical protein